MSEQEIPTPEAEATHLEASDPIEPDEAPETAASELLAEEEADPDPNAWPLGLRLGFVRGIAPAKWARRYLVATHTNLQLVPVSAAFAPQKQQSDDYDMLLERTAPGAEPMNIGVGGSRRALRLYDESISLVTPVDHELAEVGEIHVHDLGLVRLLDHPNHAPEWPAPAPWDDPAWKPRNAKSALDLVATGAGAILLPTSLARHLSSKKEHALVKVIGNPALAATTVWATWEIESESNDMQQLAGILRGRTARSSRVGSLAAGSPTQKPAKVRVEQPKKAQPKLKPGSRGAQLAAHKAKAERDKAIKNSEKKQNKKSGGRRSR